MDLVSIIIYGGMSDYCVRCLNSIKWQTYKKTEIILASCDSIDEKDKDLIIKKVKRIDKDETKWIPEAVNKAKGKFLLFLNNTSLISSDLIENMVGAYNNELNYVAAPVLYMGNKNYIIPDNKKDSVEGKLFKKERIEEIVTSYENDISIEELILSSAILFESYDFCKSGCVYNSDINELKKKPIKRAEKERTAVWLSLLANLSHEDRWEYIESWLTYKENHSNEIIDEVLQIVEIFNDDKEICFNLLIKYVKNWYDEILINKNNNKYEAIKKFFFFLPTNKVLIDIFISKLGINNSQYEMLINNSLNDYIFYYDKI